MKKAVLALLLISASLVSHAQFSVGVRTGLSCWKSVYLGNAENKTANKGNAPVWDKQVYIRYHTKKKMAFEMSAGHYYMDERYYGRSYPYSEQFDYTYNPLLSYEIDNNFIEFNLSAQYDISCRAIKNLKSYAGISVTMLTGTGHSTSIWATDTISARGSGFAGIYTGLQHYAQYTIGSHFNINSLAQFQVEPSTFFEKQAYPNHFAPNTRFSWQLGVGYQL